MMGIHPKGFLPPPLPIAVFVTVDVRLVRLPSLIRAASLDINLPTVTLPDSLCALYLEIEAARTGQGRVVCQRDQYSLFGFQLGYHYIA